MKEEIKEILEELEDCKITKYLNYNLDNKDARIILDYITNLQEIIDKAIEFVKKESKKCYSNQTTDDPQKVIGNFMWHTDKLLNILQGEDTNVER